MNQGPKRVLLRMTHRLWEAVQEYSIERGISINNAMLLLIKRGLGRDWDKDA